MKILIISGFLGAGKTSFIKAMAKATGREFVIVENEFGELGVDGEILKDTLKPSESEAEMKIWELSEGCICCSLNLDFSLSVLTIANTLNPDYLIVEPSGVAMPGHIIEQLRKICYENIELLAPVAIVDYDNYALSQKDFGDYFNDQVHTAGTVVLSKSEHADPSAFADIRKALNLREDVLFPTTHYSRWAPEMWQKILHRQLVLPKEGSEAIAFQDVQVPEAQRLESMSLKDPNIKHPAELYRILTALASGHFGRVVRAKGYVHEAHPLRFELVEKKFIITGMDAISNERAVVIGQDLKKDEIKKLFE